MKQTKAMIAASVVLLLCFTAAAVFAGNVDQGEEDDNNSVLGLMSYYETRSFTMEAGASQTVYMYGTGDIKWNYTNNGFYIGATSGVPSWVSLWMDGALYMNVNAPFGVTGNFSFVVNVRMPGALWTTDNTEFTIHLTIVPSTQVFTISYNSNGGSGSMSSDSGVAMTVFTIKDNSFNPPASYIFRGWNTRADGEGQWIDIGTQIQLISNMTLFARWTYVAPPTAAFTNSSNGLVVAFTNTSTLADSFAWDFGDGHTSTDRSPVHAYAANGTYTVTLAVSGVGGNDTKQIQLSVSSGFIDKPIPRFVESINGLSVSFTYTGTAATSFLWDFGDGATSTSNNPVHMFAGPGIKIITLSATNAGGTSTITDFIAIDVVSSGWIKESDGLKVSFYSISVGSIEYYMWDFGDGSMSSFRNPVHEYAEPGEYTVSLTVTGITGAEDTHSVLIFLNAAEPAPSGPPGFWDDPHSYIRNNPWIAATIILLIISAVLILVRFI